MQFHQPFSGVVMLFVFLLKSLLELSLLDLSFAAAIFPNMQHKPIKMIKNLRMNISLTSSNSNYQMLIF